MEKYHPGECNIGPHEAHKRVITGWISLGIASLLGFCFIVFHAAFLWRLVLLVPFTLAALGFLQAHQHFCVLYGLQGKENAEDKHPKPVHSSELDKRHAVFLIMQAITIAMMVTLLVLLIP